MVDQRPTPKVDHDEDLLGARLDGVSDLIRSLDSFSKIFILFGGLGMCFLRGYPGVLVDVDVNCQLHHSFFLHEESL